MRVSRVTPFLADLGGGKNLCFVKVDLDETALRRFPGRQFPARPLPTPGDE